jgi:uncharacterized membrane protein
MYTLQPYDVRPLHNVLWNLFLAVLPVLLAFVIAHYLRRGLKSARAEFGMALLYVAWAGFLPNTCYLLTEWRHYVEAISMGDYVPLIRYNHDLIVRLLISTAFYIFYSGSGLLAFFLSVWPLDRIIRERSVKQAAVFKIAVFALCGLGVYLGLIPRFNTWDLVRHPSEILDTTLHALTNPLVIGLMIALATTLWVLYVGFDIWMDGLMLRLKRQTNEPEA